MEAERKAVPYGVGFAMTKGKLLPWVNAEAPPQTMEDLRRRANLLRSVLRFKDRVQLRLRREVA